ncbi:FecR family protein [Abditibacterium utsteinense]|uniref:FecR family protein n=1 Tax=Abditibacterium utsteinense TaxID=1960156 RepID=A0A2S8SP59_9BACT|nr:FecR domain-containing protein [Abditibacterium utsteinense]PQV62566.1 FecR family protein [Abditibacterium utsteinense]
MKKTNFRAAPRFTSCNKSDSKRLNARGAHSRRFAFTLIQMMLVLGLIGILSALLIPAFSRATASAQRQNCDVKLKSIVLALDAFKTERGTYPANLELLHSEGYLKDPDALRCPSDRRRNASYNDFYTVRASRDAGDSPVLVCPFHEEASGGGNQARLGRFTTQFATKPAVLTAGNAVKIERQDKILVGYAGMPLRGGDEILTGASGTALVTFADSSSARLSSGTRISVLQSFVDGHSAAPLYTLIRQWGGDATYTVNHGSRFDVATPAATAGARGTQFRIKVSGNRPEDTQLYVIEGKVVLSTTLKSGLAPVGSWVSATVTDVSKLLNWLFG